MPLPENIRKEGMSYAYIAALASRLGFECLHPKFDYDSVDILLKTSGKIRPDSRRKGPPLNIQCKATALELPAGTSDINFSLPIQNYNHLIDTEETIDRILVVLLLPKDPTLWLTHSTDALISRTCAYWMTLRGLAPSTNKTKKRIKIPRNNVLTPDALESILYTISMFEEVRNG